MDWVTCGDEARDHCGPGPWQDRAAECSGPAYIDQAHGCRGVSCRPRPRFDSDEVLVCEMDQESELGRENGHRLVALDFDDVQVPGVDVNDVSDGKVAGADSHPKLLSGQRTGNGHCGGMSRRWRLAGRRAVGVSALP